MGSRPPSSFLRTVACGAGEVQACAETVTEALAPIDPQLVLFFACEGLRPLAKELTRRFPRAIVAGCSTAGEISSSGFVTDQVSALGLGSPARIAAQEIIDLPSFRFDAGPELVATLASRIGRTVDDLVDDPKRFLFIMLADGLSGSEEVLLASVGLCVPGVKLVGGSAGDNFEFQETLIASAGTCHTGAAILLLLEPCVPFRAFAGHHYTPSDRTVVVTSADPESRLVHRIDGQPATTIAAELLGVTREALEQNPNLAHSSAPIVFAFRGDSRLMYNRSVMRVQDSSLLMGGAIETGTVLSVMQANDIVDHASRGLAGVLAKLHRPAGQLLFDCGGRLLGARAAGKLEALAAVYNSIPTVGFTTYGEFYGPLLVNHTLTGVVFGEPG